MDKLIDILLGFWFLTIPLLIAMVHYLLKLLDFIFNKNKIETQLDELIENTNLENVKLKHQEQLKRVESIDISVVNEATTLAMLNHKNIKIELESNCIKTENTPDNQTARKLYKTLQNELS